MTFFRLRMHRSRLSYRQSQYTWWRDVHAVPGQNIRERAELAATTWGLLALPIFRAVILIPRMQWRYCDTNADPIYISRWQEILLPTVVPPFDVECLPPNVAVDVEWTSVSGRKVKERWGFVSTLDVTGSMNLVGSSRDLYQDAFESMLPYRIYAAPCLGIFEDCASVYVSPELSSLASRREPIPFGLQDALHS